MACALAQRHAELKAKPPRVEPATYPAQVRAVFVCAANASPGPVKALELIRPGVAHGRESTVPVRHAARPECVPIRTPP